MKRKKKQEPTIEDDTESFLACCKIHRLLVLNTLVLFLYPALTFASNHKALRLNSILNCSKL